MADALEALRRDFVERFGREPGQDDSLLVDPNAAVLTPMSADAFDAMLDRIADGVDDPVIRAKVLASRDVGYILTLLVLSARYSDLEVVSCLRFERAESAAEERV